MVRRYEKRRSVKSIYLFCEGEKTERFYFEQLRQDLRGFARIQMLQALQVEMPIRSNGRLEN